jgi:hypothetical protein
MKTHAYKNINTEYPEAIKSNQLPDFLILLIKGINNNFIFRSYDYTSNIIETVKNITDIGYFVTEFKNEYYKHIELINQKTAYMNNILDIEIADYKEKHEQHTKSLLDIISYLKDENMVNYNMYVETNHKNIELTNQLVELNKVNQDYDKVKKELELYKNNYIIYCMMYLYNTIKFFLFLN